MRARSPQSGFTLIELLVAVSLIVTVTAAVYGSYIAVARSNERLRPRLGRTQEATRALDRLTLLLRGTCLPDDAATSDVNRPPHVPRPHEPLPCFLAWQAGPTRLRWVTTARADSEGPGPWLTTLRLDRRRGQLLLRQTSPLAREIPGTDDDWEVLCEHVHDLELSFRLAGRWRPQWRASPETPLPAAVRLSLTLTEAAGQAPLRFATTARLMTQRPGGSP